MADAGTVRKFLLSVMDEMNLDADMAYGDVPLGADGLGLESIQVIQLCVRVQEEYDVPFGEELDKVLAMSLDELALAVANRAADGA